MNQIVKSLIIAGFFALAASDPLFASKGEEGAKTEGGASCTVSCVTSKGATLSCTASGEGAECVNPHEKQIGCAGDGKHMMCNCTDGRHDITVGGKTVNVDPRSCKSP